jgi:hypothetical protein
MPLLERGAFECIGREEPGGGRVDLEDDTLRWLWFIGELAEPCREGGVSKVRFVVGVVDVILLRPEVDFVEGDGSEGGSIYAACPVSRRRRLEGRVSLY